MSVRRRGPATSVPDRFVTGAVVACARDVTVARGSRTILHAVDAEVRAGELLALVGPNGAGKSTLLATLAGDIAPTHGRVDVMGAPVGTWSSTELGMRRSVLPQDVVVSFPFRVRDVVRMGRAPWARTDARDRDDVTVTAALRAADVAHLSRRSFPTLSGGERARVALARVWAQDTQLVLLDEPTASLDVHHQELVLELAGQRAARGDAVVVVLHDLGLAARHANRVVLLTDGRVVADGPPHGVLEPDLLSQVYGHALDVLTHPGTGVPLVVPRPATGDALHRP